MNEWMDPNQTMAHSLSESLRGLWIHPPAMDAWAFLVTEVGELGDLLLRAGYGVGREAYVRHHTKQVTHAEFREEIGGVMLMLCILANRLEVNLTDALREYVAHIPERYEEAT